MTYRKTVNPKSFRKPEALTRIQINKVDLVVL